MDEKAQAASALAVGAVVVLATVAIGIVIVNNVLIGTGVNIALLNTARDVFLPLIAFVAGAVAVLIILRSA